MTLVHTSEPGPHLSSHSSHPQAQPWIKASAYGIYELLANCLDLESGGGPEHAARLAPFLALVAPGTEAHLFLSLERLLKSAEVDRQSPSTEAAAKECILAHSVRYGMVSDAVLTRIMDVMGGTDYHLGRYAARSDA